MAENIGNNRYELETILFTSSDKMREVWVAFDKKKNKKVAIKIIHVAEYVDKEYKNRIIGLVKKFKEQTEENKINFFKTCLNDLKDATKEKIENGFNISKEATNCAVFNKHPYIVEYYDSFYEKGSFYIIMEYCEKGSLESNIIAKHIRISQERALKWLFQAADALDLIHEKKFIHKDIKPLNIFLDNNDNMKLGDFGLSIQLNQTFNTTGSGTAFYMSPETAKENKSDSKSDIWSLGITIYELCTGNVNCFDLHGKFIDIPFPFTKSFNELIKTMVENEPCKRPNAATVIQKIKLMDNQNIENLSTTYEIIRKMNEFMTNPDQRKINDIILIQSKFKSTNMEFENIKKQLENEKNENKNLKEKIMRLENQLKENAMSKIVEVKPLKITDEIIKDHRYMMKINAKKDIIKKIKFDSIYIEKIKDYYYQTYVNSKDILDRLFENYTHKFRPKCFQEPFDLVTIEKYKVSPSLGFGIVLICDNDDFSNENIKFPGFFLFFDTYEDYKLCFKAIKEN